MIVRKLLNTQNLRQMASLMEKRSGTDHLTYRYTHSTETRNREVFELIRYFGIFRHPLTIDELYRFSPDEYSLEELRESVDSLRVQEKIRKIDSYYLLSDEDQNCIDKRICGESMAKKLLPKARRVARFISIFPFVRFVGISGSLSKNYAEAKTDYDFFIITANNTLWICRTLLHAVKKLSFLIGKQNALCMNYFLDEHHLRLAEKNVFVRIELSTLIPVYNKTLYRTFLLRNQSVLPNLQHLNMDFEKVMPSNLLKWNKQNTFWRPLNIMFMKWTDTKWRHKWAKRGYSMQNYDLAMKTTPYISKNHPENYQKKVLEKLENSHS